MKTPFLIKYHENHVVEVKTMDDYRVTGVIHLVQHGGDIPTPYERKFNVKHDGRRFQVNLFGGSSGGSSVTYWFKNAEPKYQKD